jgi:tRNA nucleotidyltransferase (CCA-adding enzyme)
MVMTVFHLKAKMAREHVSHKDLLNFGVDKVNLPPEKANEYREQANRLKEKLEGYLADHPDFTLKRLMTSGSLAKGTALRNTSDIDLAAYITGPNVPQKIEDLLEYLAERLRKAFPNFSPDQIKPQTYSVTVSFRGSGLDVDVVPILYDGNPIWDGNLVSQDDGSFLMTNIPKHIEFIRKRKRKNDQDFAQVVRLAKFWAKRLKSENKEFRFKSFMIELIMAKLSDDGKSFSDYPEALQNFFTYLAKTDLKEMIAFSDYYPKSSIGSITDRVQIIDPVNAKNNASRLYTEKEANAIVDAALEAGDAIDSALKAVTKGDTIYYWKKVFGPTFNP